ncbi:hypothetical protein [Leptospira weilii]|uniref:Uncharacterized protein n=1 Tax=Leptospira weilii str. UI 13098 TaxID=1088542 RepID=M6QNQ1_9LEPT|nr:hypothetical protein [Leptospira weilii]EMN90472.1 hypothetical protein LEP1GSC108_2825 [Leptospira weilii str. UI 13098]
MNALKLGTEKTSNNGIFDDSNMKLLRNTKTKVEEGESLPDNPNPLSHALRLSNKTITPEALSRIETSLGQIIEKTQSVRFHISDFKNVMKKVRALNAETGCHETGIAARMYAKQEITNLITLLRELYRKY